MSRIFISLSLMPIVLIFVTMAAGWWIGDYNQAYRQVLDRQSAPDARLPKDLHPSSHVLDPEMAADLSSFAESQRRFRIHFQLGLATALATVLINSLSVTYLIGTSRWVREVSEAYELEATFTRRSTQLKRHAFPWALAGVLAILAVTALGAAADPGTLGTSTADWVVPHAIVALLGASLIVWAVLVQAYDLHRNAEIIEEVVQQVRRERRARGLEIEG